MRPGLLWRALIVGLLALGGCQVEIDFGASQFQCRQSDTCPEGHDCVDRVCVPRNGAIDAAPADAAPADASTADADPADAMP